VQEVNSRTLAIILVIAGLLALVACNQGGRTKRLVIYSPHGKEMLSEFEKRYERLYPDIDVQWIDMGSQDVYDRIRTEKENPQADLWWGAPSTMFLRAEEEDLLEPYTPSWDSVVDARFKSEHGYWYGTFLTPEVIAFNTHLLKKEDAPQDWDDLVDEKWREKILLRYPLASGTMRGVFASIIARSYERTGRPDDGYMWLLKLDANTKSYTPDPTQLYLRLAREEGEVTIWDMPDIVIQVNQNGYPFGYVIPKSGTVVLTEGIGIVKGSKNEEGARSFYEFVTSKESMILEANKFYRIPTRRDLDQAALPAWITQERITEMEVDWSLVLDHEREWMSYWDEKIKGRGRDYVEAVR
jgi:iron(III) transport system substrate-binding protein